MSNIILKSLDKEHIEWARLLHNDPEVIMMLTDPHEVSPEEQVVWFEKLQNSKSYERQMAMLGEEPVGLVRLDQIDYYNKSICVGLDIHKDHRGKGYAKPIYRLIFEDFFGAKKFNRIWLMVASYNVRAIKLYIELGFKHEGIQREALLKNGQFHDYFVMSVLRSEWVERSDR